MIRDLAFVLLFLAFAAGCGRPAESRVKIVKRDASILVGQLVAAQSDLLLIRDDSGATITVNRADVVSMTGATAADRSASAPSNLARRTETASDSPSADSKRSSTGTADRPIGGGGSASAARKAALALPAGTVLRLSLETPLSSDNAEPGMPVRARLAQPLTLRGATIVPDGARVTGTVMVARPAGTMPGLLTLSFDRLEAAQGQAATELRTAAITRTGRTVRTDDKGNPLERAGGAVTRLFGRKREARVRYENIRLHAGTSMQTTLTGPMSLTVSARSEP